MRNERRKGKVSLKRELHLLVSKESDEEMERRESERKIGSEWERSERERKRENE